MKGKGYTYADFEKSIETVADWLEDHLRQVQKLAGETHIGRRAAAMVAAIYRVLGGGRKRPRLVMRSKCPGCNPKYWL